MSDDQIIHHAIARAARRQELLTYNDLAPLVGLDLRKPEHWTQLGGILGRISRREHEHGRPLLTAIVVARLTGMPTGRFFTTAREFGVYAGTTDDDDRHFFSAEVDRVYAAWRDEPSP